MDGKVIQKEIAKGRQGYFAAADRALRPDNDGENSAEELRKLLAGRPGSKSTKSSKAAS